MELEQERELVESARRDPSAFNRLYDEYYRRIFAYVLVRTGDVSDAEDVTSEVFLKAFQNIGRFNWRYVHFSAWLYRIAGNELVNLYRQDGHRKLLKTELEMLAGQDSSSCEDELAAAEEALSRHDDFKAVHAALARLPLVYQEVIALRFFEKKPVEETARIMGKRQGTVKSLLHRGLLRLRRLLDENL